jgi:hypothetical protein
MTCTEAIAQVFAGERGVLTTRQIIDRVYALYPNRPWKENTIQAHLMGLSVNHTSGHHYPWAHKRAFLFMETSGHYRRWDPERDGPKPDDVISDFEDLPEPETETEIEVLSGAIDTSVSLERDLERALLQNLSQLEPGLTLYRSEGLSGQQLETGVVGRIDVLAVDRDGGLVVIELKAGKANDRVIGQILRYMGWVGENLAGGKPVRGMIVADDFDSAVRYAAKALPTVSLQRYQIRFSFEEV